MPPAISLFFLLAALSSGPLGAQDQNTPPGPFVSRYVVHGTVIIEGVGPAARARITGCNGQGEADSQGRFSVAGSVAAAQPCEFFIEMQGCEGRSVTVAAPAGSVALGQIILKPLRPLSAGGSVSVKALAEPPEVRKLKERAAGSLRKGKWGNAQRDLEKAIGLFPDDPEAFYMLGLSHKETKKYEEAHRAFEQSAKLDPNYAKPLVELAVLALRAQDWPDLERHASGVVSIDSKGFPDAWLYLATARLMSGDAVSAELAARNAIEVSGAKDLPKAHHILGLALAKQHRVSEAIPEIERYLALAPNAPDAATVHKQLELLKSGAVQ